jgi:hypothetical protein
MQGDRVFLTVFVTLLVGLVTAALSIVRLVNDKEGKTSDYRQGWCDSLRLCLAELVSNINSTASLIVNHIQHADNLNDIYIKNKEQSGPWPEGDGVFRNHCIDRFRESEEQIRILRREMYQSLAFLKLHFKPNEPLFTPIEKDVELAVERIREMLNVVKSEDSYAELVRQRDKIHDISEKIMNFGREILKIEWEIVKRGERAYAITKKGSLVGGGAALAILFILGGVAFFSSFSKVVTENNVEKLSAFKGEEEKLTSKKNLSENSISQVVNVNPVVYPLPQEKAKIVYVEKKNDCKSNCKDKCSSPGDVTGNLNATSSIGCR